MLKRRRARRRGGAAMTVTVPAPVGGLNTRDSLNLMPPTDAVRLDNWNPGISALSVCEGYQPLATGIAAGPVETLAAFQAGTVHKLIAAAGGGLHEVEGDVQTAFNAFGRHGALKRCVCLRPVLRGRSEARIGLGALADFRSVEAAPVAAGFGPTTPGWDAAGSAWEDWGDLPWEGGRDSTVAEWRAADGLGYTLAARMTSSSTDDLEWETLTYQIETGRGLI